MYELIRQKKNMMQLITEFNFRKLQLIFYPD